MPTITVSQEVYDRIAGSKSPPEVHEHSLSRAHHVQPSTPELSLEEWKRLFDQHSEIVQERAKSYPPGFECDVSREAVYEGCGG